MQEVTRDALVSITAFAAVFGMVYIFFMTRHRERMAILERGLSSAPFNTTNTSNNMTLKFGMLLVGIGIGAFLGSILYDARLMSEGAAFISMTCIFGGLALIVSYMVLQKQKTDIQNN